MRKRLGNSDIIGCCITFVVLFTLFFSTAVFAEPEWGQRPVATGENNILTFLFNKVQPFGAVWEERIGLPNAIGQELMGLFGRNDVIKLSSLDSEYNRSASQTDAVFPPSKKNKQVIEYSLLWIICSVFITVLFVLIYRYRHLKKEVTERKIAQEAAESANQAKSEFLANMSHEFRTPLNAILGFAQIMERNPNISSEAESLEIIQRSGKHLLTLINQVLDLSKIEAGQVVIERDCFDLVYMLRELESMFSLKAKNKDISIRIECGQEVPRYVNTDEIKLRQILINLLSNAIKFTDEGFVLLRVSVKDPDDSCSTQERVLVQFEIEDTGQGIAADELDHLFEAFRQTSTGRETHGGTGLGLVICNRFAKLLGGDIHFVSEIGKGTTVRVDIPMYVANADDLKPKKNVSKVTAVECGRHPCRMLIVDDDRNNRQLYLKLLEPFGFELREAANGKEALRICSSWEPHLVWLDIRMPMMNGYETAGKIRAMTSLEQQPIIIAVTANVFEVKNDRLLSFGCDDLLIKPFGENEIIEILKKHLNIQFLNEAVDEVSDCEALTKERLKLTPAVFQTLPGEMLLKLKKVVASLEMDTAVTIVEDMRGFNKPLADSLQRLIDEYRFDTLQGLLDQCEPE